MAEASAAGNSAPWRWGSDSALLPIDRILFGSDWPHAEGMAHPRDVLVNVESFPPEAQRRIMAENARELTFA